MVDLAEVSFPDETGGMLLGYANHDDVVVRGIIGPGPRARHRRTRFTPDAEYQQQLLEAHFHRTGGVETYLGDWHSHPRGAAGLSGKDKKTLTRIATTASSGTPAPVMAVIAGGPTDWKFAAYCYLGRKQGLIFSRASLLPLFLHIC